MIKASVDRLFSILGRKSSRLNFVIQRQGFFNALWIERWLDHHPSIIMVLGLGDLNSEN
ncbi:MAG: hypothetical protein ACJ07L_06560 [Opitutales bacterium]